MPTGTFSRPPEAGLWEPYDGRLSRTVLREPGGAIPLGYSPKHADINTWLTRNPRITLHFTPTSGSWLNLVEVFFSIITRQAIRRGSFDSVKQLTTAIADFITGWNQRCHPFVWTKTPEEILPHTCKRDSDAGH